jgi:drug/metabolite transporter (DMT)-like permease
LRAVAQPPEHSRGDILVLLAALIWGLAFYFQKTAMLHIGPLLFLALRSVVAATALLPFALREQRTPRAATASVLPIAALGGLIFLLAGALQQYGLVTATVVNTGVLTALYVVATPFAFWAIERKRPPAFIWIAVALAFLGVWGLSGGAFGNLAGGDAFVALAAVVWGIHIVVTGKSGRLAQPLTYTFAQFVVVAALSLVLAVVFEPISWSAIIDAADSILYVGLLSSALAYGVMAIALQHIPAPRASVLLSVEVVVSAAAGYALLGERLPPRGWFGAALIFAAVVLVRLRALEQRS